jgi:hypothetical protein
MHRKSLDESNLKAPPPPSLFWGLKAPRNKILGRRARRGTKFVFWVARLASGRATTRGFKTSRSGPRGYKMSWRGDRGFKMSSPGATGFSRGAQGAQVNPLNPLPVAPWLPARGAMARGFKLERTATFLKKINTALV